MDGNKVEGTDLPYTQCAPMTHDLICLKTPFLHQRKREERSGGRREPGKCERASQALRRGPRVQRAGTPSLCH